MLSYHYVPEELNRGMIRVMHMMLLAYVLPLWMQLIYMGEAVGTASVERIVIWNTSLHPVTVTLLCENLVMIVYAAVVELVQRRVRNFWIYCGSHVLCMLLMWFTLQESAGRIPRLMVCVVFMVCAFYARIHETHLGYPTAGWLAIGILMVLTASQVELQDMQTMGCATEIASAVLCILYYNAISLEHALEHTKGAGNVPYNKLQQTNLIVMAIWMVIAAVLIVFIIFSGLGDSVFDLLGQGFIWCLRQLVRFGVFLLSLLPRAGEMYQSTAGMIEEFQMEEIDPISSILLIILTAIWETLLFLQRIIAFVLIVWLIIQFCKWLYHAFYAADLEERRPVIWNRVTDYAVWVTQRSNRGLSPFDPTPAARIRRAYIGFIKSGGGYPDIQASMTPEELMTISVNYKANQVIRRGTAYPTEPIQENMKRILELYELARYMPARCTIQNVNEMHRLVRHVRKEMDRLG